MVDVTKKKNIVESYGLWIMIVGIVEFFLKFFFCSLALTFSWFNSSKLIFVSWFHHIIKKKDDSSLGSGVIK